MSPLAFALVLVAASLDEQFVGERLCYDFRIFSALHVGEACITLERGEEDGSYVATARAEPNALARNFTHVRRVTLRTFIHESRGWGKLLPYRTERIIQRDKEEIDTVYTLAGKEWRWTTAWKGRERHDMSSGVVAMPGKDGYFEDPLSAVYNFRSGVYGERKEGALVTLNALTYNGEGHIVIKILPAGEEGPRQDHALYLAQVTADGDTLGFRFRDILIWVGPHDIPLRGVIRGALPFFNITASIQGKS